MKFIKSVLITAVALFGATMILQQFEPSVVHLDGYQGALIAGLILVLVNTFIKPIINFFSLPITILTFGLFLLVVNAIAISIMDYFVDGFRVDGFWWTVGFAIIVSGITSVLNSLFGNKKRHRLEGEVRYERLDGTPIDK